MLQILNHHLPTKKTIGKIPSLYIRANRQSVTEDYSQQLSFFSFHFRLFWFSHEIIKIVEE